MHCFPLAAGKTKSGMSFVLDATLACMPPREFLLMILSHINLICRFFSDDADEEVRGVPNHSRLKVTGRAAALAHYRQMYESGKVRCMKEEP